MKTLPTRIISAVIAVLAVVGLAYFYQEDGMKFLCWAVPFLGARELIRILFKDNESIWLKSGFTLLVLGVFTSTALTHEYSGLGFAMISICFCCVCIIFEKRFEDLTSLSLFQAKGILGFFYVGLLPALAYHMLDLNQGFNWFITLLAIVFAGDTLAYITGILWGRKKILPNISPKKTVIGSFGGLAGSAVAGLICGIYLLPHVSLIGLIIVSVIAGMIAQLGDLFESMLKRVANRKDSGSIMPGHGGILDRLDGVLFGIPIVFVGALLLERLP
jgi:phosphatidate cytidylyltransferase